MVALLLAAKINVEIPVTFQTAGALAAWVYPNHLLT
ncbi:Uncharacterised protein [Yersinia aleksiciae]|uniref:Uncharacterized protein n=1 Tax=Yersinia aleksiciae TaxID=263819 RepID=A0A0T9UT54_YERAE|nr:Uncharacterised protein [Yersinia aleksiciae]CNL69172.1 Uncharacterised protein [Yersinia aleksiciae]